MRRCPRTAGFTLVEVTLTLVVLTVAGIAVPVALQSLALVPAANDRTLAVSAEISTELEQWRAVAWGSSPWPASLPYNVTNTVAVKIGGQSVTLNRVIRIQNWDPNNLSGNTSPQSDFACVQVTVDNQTGVAYLTKLLP
jgi:type II secretory pathway pseudopilin PulG